MVRYARRRSRGLSARDLINGIVVIALLLLAARFAERRETRDFSGLAVVVDGDSLELLGERIRLVGIDAPELAQTCRSLSGEAPCGEMAAAHLDRLIGAQTIVCRSRGRDQYGRALGRCRAGEFDLAESMTRDGWALSEHEYERAEASARQEKRGLWSMEFEQPAQWRARQEDGGRQSD